MVKLCILFATIAVVVGIAVASPANSRDNRGFYNPYREDPYYNSQYYNHPALRNRNYYENRQYYKDNREFYDHFYNKNFDPKVPASSARILDQAAQPNQDGLYSFSYQTENGIHAEEQGSPVRSSAQEQHEVVQGSYSYVSPEGLHVLVRYTADENGFHPTITYGGVNSNVLLPQAADVVVKKTN